jgi:hypothetical protein
MSEGKHWLAWNGNNVSWVEQYVSL